NPGLSCPVGGRSAPRSRFTAESRLWSLGRVSGPRPRGGGRPFLAGLAGLGREPGPVSLCAARLACARRAGPLGWGRARGPGRGFGGVRAASADARGAPGRLGAPRENGGRGGGERTAPGERPGREPAPSATVEATRGGP